MLMKQNPQSKAKKIKKRELKSINKIIPEIEKNKLRLLAIKSLTPQKKKKKYDINQIMYFNCNKKSYYANIYKELLKNLYQS